jgi:hypothetical protein
MLRKRQLIKLLIGIPVIWIVVMLIVGLNDTGTSNSPADLEKIKALEEKNSRLIAEAARKHEEDKRHRNEEQNKNNEANKEDHDHPEEERIKAQQQQKEKAGPIQVHAPRNQDPNAPGELGKPVNIDKDKLSPEERKKYDDGWKNNAFNQYVSDMISIHRSLADIRDPA